MTWLIVFLVIVVVLAALPLVLEARRTMPERARARGRFAELPSGQTHYAWHGGVRGPVAVCIHGLTTPSQVWDGLVPELTGLGYRVLVYDLYGRGFSDTVSGRQDAPFFVRQLEELLADQGLSEDLTLLGYSMGGSIATAFAAKNEHMVRRIVLVASAGIEHEETPFYRFVRQTPVVGRWLHDLVEPIRMRRAIDADAAHDWPEIHAARRAELGRAGFFRAVLSSRRGILTDRQEAEHREISRADIPVLAVFGEADAVIPLRSMGMLAQWNRAARKEMIDNAGHDLVYRHADAIGALFREVLRED